MKKLMTIMGLLLAVAALYSCNNKEDSLPVEQMQGRRFRAVLEQPVEEAATKAYANSDYKLFWNQGDRLSIFYDWTYNREYEFINLDGATAGEFERVGQDPSHFSDQEITTGYDYAILPYHRINNMCDTEGNLTLFIPAKQEFYNDPFGIGARPLMVARDKGGVLMFKHVGCYVGVRLKGDRVKVASVSIEGNNSEILAGRLKVSFDSEGLPVSEFDPQFVATTGSKTVTMTLSEPVELSNDDYKVFWFNLPEIKFENGLVITVTDVNGEICQINKDASLNFQRTYFYRTSATVEFASSAAIYSLAISPTSSEINVGETQAFTLTLTTTTNGTDATSTVTTTNWTSSDTAIATVENGVVSGLKEGEVTITAKYMPEGASEELSATATLTVNKDPNNAGDPTPGEDDTF
jgi:hypothetical protein